MVLNGEKSINIRSWMTTLVAIATLILIVSGGGFDIIPFSQSKVDTAQNILINQKLNILDFEKQMMTEQKEIDAKFLNNDILLKIYLENINSQLKDIKEQLKTLQTQIETLKSFPKILTPIMDIPQN